jgi:hypothetical protein
LLATFPSFKGALCIKNYFSRLTGHSVLKWTGKLLHTAQLTCAQRAAAAAAIVDLQIRDFRFELKNEWLLLPIR